MESLAWQAADNRPTTANSLAWALWEASKQPSLQDRIANEGATLSNNPADNQEWSNHATWTEATVQESLRMYPSVWVTSRRTLSDYRLGDFLLPKDTFVYTSQWVTHRDPRWFTNPLEFRPERWNTTKSESDAAGRTECPSDERPQFAFFPFGGGKRFCIGKALFDQEATMLLASFFKLWESTQIENCHPEPRFGVTMQPDRPMLVRITRRQSTSTV